MWSEVAAVLIGIAVGIFIGTVSQAGTQENRSSLQEHMADPKWQTVEAWGTGYAQGFNDSKTLCRNALRKQREMMLEQMEPTPPGWNSAETPSSGTDRNGTSLPRFGGPTLP